MNILITGASGFIGTALAKYLADKHTLICLSRQAPEGADNKSELTIKSSDNGVYRCLLSNSESFNICKIGFAP